MPKSLYEELLDNEDVDVECPGCDKEFKIKFKQIESEVKCPHCGVSIEFQTEGDGLADIKESLDDFEKTLNNLGK